MQDNRPVEGFRSLPHKRPYLIAAFIGLLQYLSLIGTITLALLAIRSDANVRQGAAFLRALDLPEREAFLLYQLPDGQFLTTDYLVSLIDRHMGRSDEKTLRASVTDVLCKHIRGMREINPNARNSWLCTGEGLGLVLGLGLGLGLRLG